VLETVFEFLFKYRPLLFQQGDFALRASWLGNLAIIVAAAAAFLTLRTYSRVRGNSKPRDRRSLAVVRVAVLAVLAFCLLRPVLILSSVVPQENFLGILVDDSRSMQIADVDGIPRSEFIEANFGAAESELLSELSDRFALRFFSFSNETDRVSGADEVQYAGTRTHLGQALARAQSACSLELGFPVTGDT
jgi:hypothetical protein